jgi:hypothetical protein
MLSYDELSDIARLKRLSLVNAEKDYLQDLVLFSLYSQVGPSFVFKGGTCLFKVYNLNRFSEDLDFTLTEKVDVKKITGKIVTDSALLGIKGKIKEIREYRNEINIRLLFRGPLYNGSKSSQCFIPLNISMKEKVLLAPKQELLQPVYRELRSFYVFAMQEKEIVAEKVRAVLTREKPRDVYDLWFLLGKGVAFDLGIVNKKLNLYRITFDLDRFASAIKRKKGLWQTDLKNLVFGELPDFDEVVGVISAKAKKSFNL